jgi:hypothetical protein
MNEFSKTVFKELIKVFPEWIQFQDQAKIYLEIIVPSPSNPNIGGIVIQTSEDETIWLRIFPEVSSYAVDTVEELITIIKNIFAGKIFWLICYKDKEWYETTLINNSDNPVIESGVTCKIYSWSGNHDKILSN